MKKCKKCCEVKDLTEFYTMGKQPVSGKIKYKPTCKVCELQSRREEYDRRTDLIKARYGSSCTVCGYDRYWGALEFHHRDPQEKEHEPAKMVSSWKPMEEIFRELDKCVLLCSNCHREVHGSVLVV